MDTTRGILFLVVTLIIIVSIYYIVKMVKGKRTPTQPSTSPSPSDQTDEISISDLKFERTLNPDKSNSKGGDIVGYTIEYAGVNYEELSKNVTFTLTWKNNIGFDNVNGFKIEHYVKGVDANATFPDDANQSIDFKTEKTSDTDTTKNAVNLNNFGENSVSIVSNGYSVVGKNRFKIKVIMNDGSDILLYDGLDTTNINETTHEIVISEQDLGATLEMTVPQTVTYTPVTRSFTATTFQIKKTKYWVYNEDTNLNIGDEFIYLIPASSGTTTTNPDGSTNSEKTGVDTFFFQYEDGDYLLSNLTLPKGKWNEKERAEGKDGDTNYDNRMYVSFYNKSEDDNTMELRKVPMGYGYGDEMITSGEEGKLKLMSAFDTDSVDETEFKNSKWTFVDTKEMTCTNDTIRVSRFRGDLGWKFCRLSSDNNEPTLDCGSTTTSDSSYENASNWKITKVGAGESGSGYTLTSTYKLNNTNYTLYLYPGDSQFKQYKFMKSTTDETNETLLQKSDFKDVESHNRFYCADKYMRIDMIDYLSNM